MQCELCGVEGMAENSTKVLEWHVHFSVTDQRLKIGEPYFAVITWTLRCSDNERHLGIYTVKCRGHAGVQIPAWLTLAFSAEILPHAQKPGRNFLVRARHE